MDFAELPCTAGLLLVAVVGAGYLGDGFAVGYLRLEVFNGNLVVVFDAPFEGAEVKLALSGEDGLFQFLGLFDNPCRVFFVHAQDDFHHLFGVGFVNRLHGAAVFGVGIFNEVKLVIDAFPVQSVAATHFFQFDGGTYIAGSHFGHSRTVLSGYDKQLGDAFLRASVGIHQVIAFLYFPRHDLEIGHLPDVGFNSSLEEEQADGGSGIGLDFLSACRCHRLHFGGRRGNQTEEVHNAVYAHVMFGRDAENGEHAAAHQACLNAGTQVFLAQCPFFKEFLHQGIVVLGGGFHEGFLPFGSLFGFFCRNIQDFGSGISLLFPSVHLHFQYVNDGIKRSSGVGGVLNGYYLAAPTFPQLGKRAFIVCLVVIQVIDKEDNRLLELLCIAELVDSAHFHTVLGIQKHQRTVGHIQGRHSPAYKVVRPRTIDEVQLRVLPLQTEKGGKHRVAVLLFHRKIVGHRISCIHTPASFYNATLEKHSFCEGGFPGTRTPQDGDVLNVICLIYLHVIKNYEFDNTIFLNEGEK
ncbi:hypothetical protein Barb7_02497 [Bacteroidales bacterium Barb7]|nr:hypothetical protein Barb7_02497 [Bacteroidales bacterium Barb7]